MVLAHGLLRRVGAAWSGAAKATVHAAPPATPWMIGLGRMAFGSSAVRLSESTPAPPAHHTPHRRHVDFDGVVVSNKVISSLPPLTAAFENLGPHPKVTDPTDAKEHRGCRVAVQPQLQVQ